MKQKGQAQILVVALVIGLLTLGGYFIYQNRNELPRSKTAGYPSESSSTNKPTPLPQTQKEYCNNDEDCTYAKCACKAENKQYSFGLVCTIACPPATPRCISNKCTLVSTR